MYWKLKNGMMLKTKACENVTSSLELMYYGDKKILINILHQQDIKTTSRIE